MKRELSALAFLALCLFAFAPGASACPCGPQCQCPRGACPEACQGQQPPAPQQPPVVVQPQQPPVVVVPPVPPPVVVAPPRPWWGVGFGFWLGPRYPYPAYPYPGYPHWHYPHR